MKHLWIFALTIFLLDAQTVGANEKSDAKKHFDTAVTLLEKQDYRAAAAEFDLSVRLYPTKNNIYNLANCQMAIHRYGQALIHFERLLDEFGAKLDKEMRADIDRQIKEVNRIAARLNIQVNLPNANILVNGEEAGTSPREEPFVLGPGTHTVTVSLEGYKTVTRSIRLSSGKKEKLEISLQRTHAVLSVTASEAGANVVLNEEEVGVTPLPSPLRVKPGLYRVSVNKSGFEPMTEELTLAAGEETPLHFELQTALSSSAASLSSAPANANEKGSRLTPIFWAGLAGFVAFGGAGGALWGVAISKSNEAENKADVHSYNLENEWDLSREEDQAAEASARREVDELDNQAATLNKVAVGMTVAAGACAVLAVVGLFVGRKDKVSSKPTLSVGPGSLSLTF